MDLPQQMFKVSINLTASANEDCYIPDCPPLCPPVSSPPAPTIIKFVPPGNHSNNQTLSPLVIIIVSIFASSFLLVCCYVILLKLFSRWNLQRRPPRENNDTHDELEENQNSFNQFWYIRTVGLDESIINSIAICRYKKDEGLIDGTECSVCLNEFRDSENLRLLPKCSHAFHLPCIDTWLKSHVNCPLCRAHIVCNPPLNSSSSSDHTLSDQVQAETENNIGSDDQATATEVIPEANDVSRERDIVLLETGCSYSPSTANSPFPIPGDLATEYRSQETDMIDEIQPTRRSVSMDDYSSSMICLDLAGLHRTSSTGSSTAQKSSTDHKRFNFGEFSGLKAIILKPSANHSNFKQLGDVHRGPSLQKGPIAMKRSFSSSSKFFLSRYSRSRNSSVLPL